MTRITRAFLLVESVAFAGASLTHLGVLLHGYEHQAAGIAEAVISGLLILGLAATLLRPGVSRLAGLAAQGFALVGTSVGVFSMVRGFGPRSAADLGFHVGILAVLVVGLIVVFRGDSGGRTDMDNRR
jgi:hypothetical protein